MLEWPKERPGFDANLPEWKSPGSNICLDFHGDPSRADLVIFSDGNHHMALEESLDVFCRKNGQVNVFYATTPPGPILKMMEQGGICLGNLIIRACPHVFISPPHILENLKKQGRIKNHKKLASNRGCVLLVQQGNPKKIFAMEDLNSSALTLFISNPNTERVSFTGYARTVNNLAGEKLIHEDPAPDQPLSKKLNLRIGAAIHHREAHGEPCFSITSWGKRPDRFTENTDLIPEIPRNKWMMNERLVVLTKEPAELCKILKFENLVMSGGEAKQVIAAGLVRVNQEVETRKRRKIYAGDRIEFQGQCLKVTASPVP